MTKMKDKSTSDGRTKNSGKGKMKIEIAKIENIARKRVVFSKRRMGLLKKAFQYKQMSGANIAVIAFSSSGHLYTNDDDGKSVDAIVDEYQKLIDKEKDVNASSEKEEENETTNLIEWILEGMIKNVNDDNVETLLAMKTKLEMIKQEVDNLLVG